ncbi:MAG TPA: hypothetical protein VGO62_17480 [Myxococcota bacterium]|jgi:hypothetical protein
MRQDRGVSIGATHRAARAPAFAALAFAAGVSSAACTQPVDVTVVVEDHRATIYARPRGIVCTCADELPAPGECAQVATATPKPCTCGGDADVAGCIESVALHTSAGVSAVDLASLRLTGALTVRLGDQRDTEQFLVIDGCGKSATIPVDGLQSPSVSAGISGSSSQILIDPNASGDARMNVCFGDDNATECCDLLPGSPPVDVSAAGSDGASCPSLEARALAFVDDVEAGALHADVFRESRVTGSGVCAPTQDGGFEVCPVCRGGGAHVGGALVAIDRVWFDRNSQGLARIDGGGGALFVDVNGVNVDVVADSSVLGFPAHGRGHGAAVAGAAGPPGAFVEGEILLEPVNVTFVDDTDPSHTATLLVAFDAIVPPVLP